MNTAKLQQLVYGLVGILLRGIVQVRMRGLNEAALKPNVHYVLYANHQSYFDIPVVSAFLPRDVRRRLRPFRYFLLNSIYDRFRLVLRPMGLFPARKHGRDAYGIVAAEAALNAGQTVLIFPEGTRTIPGEHPPHRGITVLADLSYVELIPISIQWTRAGPWHRKCLLTYGQPFVGAGLTPDELMARAYALAKSA